MFFNVINKRNLNLVALIILFVSSIGFSFWWYEIRTSKIRKECVEYIKTLKNLDNAKVQDLDFILKVCLYKNGIKN